MDQGQPDEITLAFELDALRRLADPTAVWAGASGWAGHIGIVSDEPTHVATRFARERNLPYDFFSGMRDKHESLGKVRTQPEFLADRYIFVGVGADDAALAEETDWEFLDVQDAAEAAGWALAEDEDDEDAEEDERDPGEREGWP